LKAPTLALERTIVTWNRSLVKAIWSRKPLTLTVPSKLSQPEGLYGWVAVRYAVPDTESLAAWSTLLLVIAYVYTSPLVTGSPPFERLLTTTVSKPLKSRPMVSGKLPIPSVVPERTQVAGGGQRTPAWLGDNAPETPRIMATAVRMRAICRRMPASRRPVPGPTENVEKG